MCREYLASSRSRSTYALTEQAFKLLASAQQQKLQAQQQRTRDEARAKLQQALQLFPRDVFANFWLVSLQNRLNKCAFHRLTVAVRQ